MSLISWASDVTLSFEWLDCTSNATGEMCFEQNHKDANIGTI